ncbi:hypothetical protein [Planctellipticum variicoloris]|uniref:hypothetical protein n=1 Tax=Planctellipticum variicoloris TaxID=3064265 RepID=UPI003013A505|nr:hypothetical protein SH412_001780 [Planctomycetaceae bacterium SH412]
MFRFVVLLTLVAQTLQLFACCESCCADASAATAPVAEAPKCCHHHHDKSPNEAPNAPRQPAHPDDSHHVCLATHVFYVRDARGGAAAATGELQFALLPAVAGPRLSAVPLVEPSRLELLHPGIPAATARAALGVYLL